MPVVISGTNGVSGVDGTASNPSYEGTDANTGVFFPAADTVAIGTNGTEALRVNSSQNVGIGTSSISSTLTVKAQSGMGAPLRLESTDAGANPQTVFAGSRTYQIGTGNASSGFAGSLFFYDGTAAQTRMLIDSSGNVGIGTTAPAVKFQVEQNQAAYTYSDLVNTTNGGGAIYRLVIRNIANTATTTVDFAKLLGSGLAINNNDTNAANFTSFGVGASERMRIDSSGNVGIGTSSPAVGVHLNRASGNTYYRAQNNLTNADFGTDGAGTGILWNNGNYPLAFGTNNTERARIDSSGNLLVGTTSQVGSGRVGVSYSGASFWGVALNDTNGTSGNRFVDFGRIGTSVGSITLSGTTAVAYNTSSDYRLKNTIAPMTGALAKVAALKPCTYKWKADGSAGEGFIAHELAEVVPQCVTGEKDAVDSEGNPQYQGIDTSFLAATLTAAIQEQQQMIETLQAKVAALEAK
jgi:hypothetical protein